MINGINRPFRNLSHQIDLTNSVHLYIYHSSLVGFIGLSWGHHGQLVKDTDFHCESAWSYLTCPNSTINCRLFIRITQLLNNDYPRAVKILRSIWKFRQKFDTYSLLCVSHLQILLSLKVPWISLWFVNFQFFAWYFPLEQRFWKLCRAKSYPSEKLSPKSHFLEKAFLDVFNYCAHNLCTHVSNTLH